MLDWTDRHCRYFYRQLSRKALLYSEMTVAEAIIHGRRDRLLGFAAEEHPVALQIGGADPQKLAEAAHIGEDFGYDEINLNVGCPSDRVQAGAFGACLMLEPDKVARAVEAMKKSVSLPVTVKCRIGVDKFAIAETLDKFAAPVWQAGADAFWVHARKVWLDGLSPKENREIPPLDYERVYRFKRHYAGKFVGINGGIATIEEAKAHLQKTDGVMLGRAIYHNPALLTQIDSLIDGDSEQQTDYGEIINIMADYCAALIAAGGRLHQVTRHMIGLFHGVKGAKAWRQILSSKANESSADCSVLYEAFAHIDFADKGFGPA
ncbi:MAG: tRNA dihydrouridine(20/20a) synthase DusA [Candidatus Tokpelaia sp.]|nr:MAG: tRNA dihydrouridine(20/20a) synthase DusA [Candidatus Tokpelaia sp.]KAA6207799.1 MAG: tRNA dihydrouridine(20/20a) synthase DusA [Candidatus Tokpelaia sp.]KAA6404993.1 tRNA dihydrouridine(20/20a) synthase DusA [Candidatus Tokpelaia sp.]